MITWLLACVELAPRCDEVISGYLDADGDGYGAEKITGCEGDTWIVDEDDDCDDGDAAAMPGGTETWYDGVDGDCDGGSDFDQDGDGYDAEAGGGDDCDDTRDEVNPGRAEVFYNGTDDACDGGDDYDQDGDGYRSFDECDDENPAINPAAEEIWYDGVDQDCDLANDYDQDGDGWERDGGDCDDLHADANPEGVEDCDGVDDDCDGVIDDGFDEDGDGYAGCSLDCDDADPEISPDAIEVCDGVDQDCDGATDEDFDLDADGWSTCAGDCDDENAAANPAGTEVWYDGVDEDCDGGGDFDQDGDGHDLGGADCDDTDASVHAGAPEVAYDGIDQDCAGGDLTDADGDGWDADVVGGDDCDDGDDAVHPGAAEHWYDGVDQDCDGASDYDQDGDGFDRTDECDDTDATINPSAVDAWYDGVDQDCDGASDYDQDGDGYDSDAYGGDDCDDLDTGFSPAEVDALDGDDQDCDGVADNPDPEDVAIAVVRGEDAGQAIGSGGVALDADLDGDGEAELLIASPADTTGGADAGAVWVFGWSELGDVPVSDAWLTIEGGTGDGVGSGLSAGFDWTGDGVGDLAIGASGTDIVYLVEPDSATSSRHAASTLAYATLTGTAATDFGAAVCSGDFDGDGDDDLVVGAPSASSGKGAVYVFEGSATARSVTVSSADYTVPGADSGDGIGTVLACGDATGDGLDDFAVGVPGDDENSRTNSGSVFLVAGAGVWVNLGLSLESVDSWTLTGSVASQAVGRSVAIDDVDGSGTADVVVGASGYTWTSGTGAVGVFDGSVSGTESFTAADRLVRGTGGLGTAVAAGDDLDGDGADDLLVGGNGDGWIVSLAVAGTLDLPGDQAAWFVGADGFGAAVSPLGRDLDGDGVTDVAVAATDDAGAVYVLGAFP